MKSSPVKIKRILAISPRSEGFGFAILEAPGGLIQWGVKGAKRNRKKVCLDRAIRLIHRYHPTVVVLEDLAQESRRAKWSKTFLAELIVRLGKMELQSRLMKPVAVRKVLGFPIKGRINKHQLAIRIVERFPELMHSLPPKRKLWESEDPRFSIFKAVGLILAH